METNGKKKKKFVIVMIVCFVLSAVLFFIAFFVTALFESPINEANTIELKGTFERVEKEKKDYFIYVEEYKSKLMLPAISILDIDYLPQLVKGETVYFRIYNASQELLADSKVQQLAIFTLKTKEKDIVTFNSYNKFEEKQTANAKITGIVFASIFALGSVYCVLKLWSCRNYTKHAKQNGFEK